MYTCRASSGVCETGLEDELPGEVLGGSRSAGRGVKSSCKNKAERLEGGREIIASYVFGTG